LKTQQTAVDLWAPAGAFKHQTDCQTKESSPWETIDWLKAEGEVKRLQRRIARAVQEKRWGKVRVLCRILTRSRSAKWLAARRVITNKGARTPGVDNILWRTPQQYWEAAQSLGRRGYRAQPLRRVYIEKRNGKLRPLGIPTMKDRAMQALYALALAPIVETCGDPNSYGFRPFRCTHDAIEQLVVCLSRRCSGQWVLEGDIKACFDEIEHQWLLDHVPMDREVLRQWLKAGFVEKRQLFPTRAGTPQGGVISPLLANWTLDGLEAKVKGMFGYRPKVHVIRYADDFVVVAETKEILEQKVKPAIQNFMAERGLRLSEEKTVITHIKTGFDFLGKTLRKFGPQLIVQPSKAAAKSVREKLGALLSQSRRVTYDVLLSKLNRLLRGWANYHRFSSASRVFGKLDYYLLQGIWRWIKRRHKGKRLRKHLKQYFAKGFWTHSAWSTDTRGALRLIELVRLGALGLRRHIKIRGKANPYDPTQADYFRMRQERGTSIPAGA
jgi:RNA-directed DNA polymerase